MRSLVTWSVVYAKWLQTLLVTGPNTTKMPDSYRATTPGVSTRSIGYRQVRLFHGLKTFLK